MDYKYLYYIINKSSIKAIRLSCSNPHCDFGNQEKYSGFWIGIYDIGHKSAPILVVLLQWKMG